MMFDVEMPKPCKLHDKRLAKGLSSVFRVFLETAHKFDKKRIKNTIVIFGSSQIASWENSQRNMRAVQTLFDKSKHRTEKHWGFLDRASNIVYMSRYYDAAEELSFRLSKWAMGVKQKKHHFLLCSGGGPGLMEATNKGAARAGAESIGLTINLPSEEMKNLFITPELRFEFSHFFVRKFWFHYFAKAFIIFPGGFGTMDELFEILNLHATRKINQKIPIVFFGKEFWKEVINFDPLIRYSTIKKEDIVNFYFTDSVEDAFIHIITKLKENFIK